MPQKLKLNIADDFTKDAVKSLNAQFAEYAKGDRRTFDLGKLGLHGDLRELSGTALQKAVWQELLSIPYGDVISYEELAKRVGNPKAVRAVASAVGDNPLCIVIPCHRVLPKASVEKLEKFTRIARSARSHPADSQPKSSPRISVGGYAYGTDMKEALLAIEGVM